MKKLVEVSRTVQTIFDQYIAKVLDPTYFPSNPQETFLSRVTATYLINHNRPGFKPDVIEKAKDFILRTSINSEDVERLTDLSKQITSWDEIQVCSTQQTPTHQSCEYKLKYQTKDGEKQLHLHAKFTTENEHCRFESQHPPFIRVIGDPILHRSGIPFPENPTPAEIQELKRQIEIAEHILVATGGGGIAANQCAAIERPYQFAIVGVFNQNPVHVHNVDLRYPGVKFPDAVVMINPKITHASTETMTFLHGCLSVPGPLRGEITTPREISVEYMTLNPQGNIEPQTKTAKDMDAVVLKHELNHILGGKTYVDACLAKLNGIDLNFMRRLVLEERDKRRSKICVPPDLSHTKNFYRFVYINSQGESLLDANTFLTALATSTTTETLFGLRMRLLALHDQRWLTAPPRLQRMNGNTGEAKSDETVTTPLAKL